jgi:WD40 repeat protein
MEAIQSFLRFDEPQTALSLFTAWRRKSEHALVIVDQFEELFTLTPPEVQESFAALLGQLVLAADVHVLLSLRDDFLFQCQKHESLSPVFSELTPLGTLSPSGLRRALVQPALACGYRFEDESLAEEMVSEVSRERGALPLLAFAASRLWDKRDREKGLLTREAYQEIGGVGGALARHAEETLDKIGAERTPIVRELFRNLVTAQGTRASRDVEELLSIFPKEEERRVAGEVLRELVSARLLTSYETSVEIIHESLLAAWPRLVRWRNQDEGGALLRDQLRQAAHLWDERGRSEDLLWTGSSYREFSLWRERYAGGLSSTEDDFARAMSSLANRKRRMRRIAVSAVVVSLTVGLGIVGALWKRSETQALRAEASKLLALGQLQLERHPTAAVAYAIQSLELADGEESRRFALRALQNGPVGIQSLELQQEGLEAIALAFSPNGEWLALGGYRKVAIRHRDGREPIILKGEYPSAGPRAVLAAFAPDGRTLVTNRRGDLRWWSVPEGRLIRKAQIETGVSRLFQRGTGFFTSTTIGDEAFVRIWSFADGEVRLVGTMDAPSALDIDAKGQSMVYARGNEVFTRSFDRWASGPELLAEHSAEVAGIAFHPSGDGVAVSDASGEIRIWSVPRSERPPRVLGPEEGTSALLFSQGGRWLAARGQKSGLWILRLWELSAPPGAAPLEVRNDAFNFNQFAFDPSERWLVTNHADYTFYWPLEETYPRVLEGHEGFIDGVAFTPDGGTLVSVARDRTVRAWPLDPESGQKPRVLLQTDLNFPDLALDPGGASAVISATGGRVLEVPIEGGPVRTLEGFSEETIVRSVTISPEGGRVAAGPNRAPLSDKFIRVWDLDSGLLRASLPIPGAGEGGDGGIDGLAFADEDHLLAAGSLLPLHLLDLRDGTSRRLSESQGGLAAFSTKGRFGFFLSGPINQIERELFRFSLDDETMTPVPAHFPVGFGVVVDAKESLLASGSPDGTVRIGPVSGTEPHLFFGHRADSNARAFSPDGRWLASGSADRTIRLWPVPDVTKAPPQRQSREDFLAALRSRTNLRLVQDERVSTGWRLEVRSFPGWKTLPKW